MLLTIILTSLLSCSRKEEANKKDAEESIIEEITVKEPPVVKEDIMKINFVDDDSNKITAIFERHREEIKGFVSEGKKLDYSDNIGTFSRLIFNENDDVFDVFSEDSEIFWDKIKALYTMLKDMSSSRPSVVFHIEDMLRDIDNKEINPNFRGIRGGFLNHDYNILHFMISISVMAKTEEEDRCFLNCIKKLVEKCKKIDAFTLQYKYTALHLAYISENHKIVKILLDAGADVDAKDLINQTPAKYEELWN